MKRFVLLVFTSVFCYVSYATSNWSMYFTYRHLNGLQWEVTQHWFYNCDYYPGFLPQSFFYYHDTCNYIIKTNTYSTKQLLQPNGNPAGSNIYTDYCPNSFTMCDSPFNATGMISWRLVNYRDTVTLPEACGLWKFSLGSASQFQFRDPFITNIQDSTWTAYGEAILNADTTLANNTALWKRPMFAYANADQFTQWHLPVYDDDGDSLVMSLVKPRERDKQAPNPLDTLIQDINYISPFSLAEPFQTNGTFEFDASIPAVRFKATVNQLALLCFRVDEYREGVYVGTTFREALWHTIPTVRPSPQRSIQTTSLQNAIPGMKDTITVYANYAMNLCTHYTSSSNVAELRYESNIADVLPNATNSVQSLGDSVYTCIQWTPTLADTGYHLLVTTITDTSCTSAGPRIPQDFFYKIIVKQAPNATENVEQLPIHIYPNPTQDELYVEGLANTKVQIYNSMGTRIAIEEFSSNYVNRITTSSLANGLYLLQAKGKTLRFMVQR